MRVRLSAALTTTALALLTGPADAAPASEVTSVLVGPLPCQDDPGLFEITLVTADRLHERETDSRYHEDSSSRGTFSAAPVTVDAATSSVTPRAGATWSGATAITHVANNGQAGAGHAVSTFRMRLRGESSTGDRLAHGALAHIAGTAVPTDPASVVRVFFSKTACR